MILTLIIPLLKGLVGNMIGCDKWSIKNKGKIMDGRRLRDNTATNINTECYYIEISHIFSWWSKERNLVLIHYYSLFFVIQPQIFNVRYLCMPVICFAISASVFLMHLGLNGRCNCILMEAEAILPNYLQVTNVTLYNAKDSGPSIEPFGTP